MTERIVEDDNESCFPKRKPRRPRSMRWKAYVVTWWIKSLAKVFRHLLWLDVTVLRGAAIPAEGPVVVMGNHLSFVDPLLWCATITRNGAILAKAELWRNIFTMLLVRIRGDIPVARESDEERNKAFQEADVVLSHGGLVGGYPEGGINRSFWRTGLFRLARKHMAPIVLVHVVDTNVLFPSTKSDMVAQNGKRFNRKAKLQIIYSDPIPFDVYKDMTDAQVAKYAHEICMDLAA